MLLKEGKGGVGKGWRETTLGIPVGREERTVGWVVKGGRSPSRGAATLILGAMFVTGLHPPAFSCAFFSDIKLKEKRPKFLLLSEYHQWRNANSETPEARAIMLTHPPLSFVQIPGRAAN